MYDKVQRYTLKQEVTKYLIGEKGYQRDEILELTTKRSKAPPYVMQVVFKDEPDIIYTYWKRDSTIIQSSWGKLSGRNDPLDQPKHKEGNTGFKASF
ncbi:hypothetical protein J31TS4_14900 [Paenibacillus sp. J31TS4]|nr:hypothetical protein J31TS4_14900 [Paenibacillus sp. J31TS4]